MSPSGQALPLDTLTDERWAEMVRRHRDAAATTGALPPDFLLRFHGGRPEAVAAYRNAPALPLRAFAACMGVPASTVRYYTRLGFLPFFHHRRRVLYPNFACMLLARVIQYRRLGLGIAAIAEQLRHERELGEAHLAALREAGGDPLEEAREDVVRATLESSTVQDALQRFVDTRTTFLNGVRQTLEARRAEVEAQLDELGRLAPGLPSLPPPQRPGGLLLGQAVEGAAPLDDAPAPQPDDLPPRKEGPQHL